MKITEIAEGGAWLRESIQMGIPFLNSGDVFELPMYGPGDHAYVMGKIDSDTLLRPTVSQVLSLVDIVLQYPQEPYCEEILKKLKNGYKIWTATQKFLFPGGVFVYDNIDGKLPFDIKYLMELRENGDDRVRIVNEEFKIGEMSVRDSIKNQYTIALVGGEDNIRIYKSVAENTYSGRYNSKVCVNCGNTELEKLGFIAVGLQSEGMLKLQDYDGEYSKAFAPGVVDTRESDK